MFAQDYLVLHLIQLKSSEEWFHQGEGLSFLLLEAGGGRYRSSAATQQVAAGDVLVLDGAGEGKLSGSNGGMAFWAFALRFEHLLPLFAGKEISLLHDVTEGFKGMRYYPAASPVAAECHRMVGEVPPQFSLDHRIQLLRVAAAILTEEFKKMHGHRTGFVTMEEHLIQVFEKLSGDELLVLSVDELAARFGCSRRHLNRLFHQYFGYSVSAFRMEMRLSKAISLLRDPKAKVINVAEKCRFNHLGLFNSCFKRRFGTSPGRWRGAAAQAAAGAGMLPPGAPALTPSHHALCPVCGKPRSPGTEPPPAAGLPKPVPAKGMVKAGDFPGTGAEAAAAAFGQSPAGRLFEQPSARTPVSAKAQSKSDQTEN